MKILLEILVIALAALAVARLAADPWRGRLLNALKAWVTVRVFWLLLMHPVAMEDGSRVLAWRLIHDAVRAIDPRTFWLFVAAAAAIKFVGILASMQRWRVLLRGQGIDLPFWHIFGSFLIGRFIGTFLPSTAGLDGYTLYDAARFSGRTVEVTAAKALEKVIGITGIFLTFLVALPAGMVMFHSILGEQQGERVAFLGAAVCLAVIGGLLMLLWFPGLVQWLIEHLPIPGKARLEGVVLRISHAAAAYKDKKRLILLALALSFVVHFTTAAMYYFTALAISAQGVEFWPVVLASSIQILATVLSPFTIAGEGIRELAQLVLLQHMIGPAAAIVSGALGFWAAEGLTLFGGIFWWIRPRNYTPPSCLVDGVQVDFAEAAKAAVALETEEERARRHAAPASAPPPLAARLRAGAGYGLGAGILAGLLVALPETLVIATGGFGTEAQVLWYGPLCYAGLFAGLCLVGGVVLALLPMELEEIRGWTPSLALLATLVPVGLFITLFRLRRDVYMEQMPPLPVLAAVLLGFALLAALLFFVAPRVLRGPLGAIFRPFPALSLLAVFAVGGFAGTQLGLASGSIPAPAGPVPAALASRPNLILVMVDTLRADHLSCYGAKDVKTPHVCGLAEDGGTLFNGFSHASWTKPATATLLTSLVPSSHQTMSKTAALPEGIETVAEALKAHGYETGGFVSNTNLAPSFGFAQGFDDYVYLGPDYLMGAQESSSKLILYQVARRVYFKLVPHLRFGDFYQDSKVVNQHAYPWLERHKNSRFFLFLHYMDVHDPYFDHPYDGKGIDRAAHQHPDPSKAGEMHRLYKGEIEYMDGNFGHFVAKLKTLGLYDNSVIILVADHGEEFDEHGGFWHGTTLYDEQIHVPFIVKWQKGHPLARPDERGDLVRLIDVAPTLLARAGAPVPTAMQGRDVGRNLAARSASERTLFAEENLEGNDLRALRTMQWKWIQANKGNPRGLPVRALFDVVGDRAEMHNLVKRETQVADEMHRRTDSQLLAAQKGKVGEKQTADVSREQCQALVALGYLKGPCK